MNSKLIQSASLVALVATVGYAAAGCQSPAWQNPYAAFGPATVPAANMQATPQPGYYQPPAATPTLPGASPAAPSPASIAPPTVTLPDGTIRTEIPTTRSTNAPTNAPTTSPAVATPARSPLSASGPANEAPIRIVEASPARPSASSSSRSTFATAPRDTPAAVIAANPTSRTTTTSSAPAVQFNPSTTTSPPNSTLPSTTPPNSTLNRTRGYLPPAAPSTAPKNRTMSAPSTSKPGIRRDSSVSQAAFVETANNANGEWKAR